MPLDMSVLQDAFLDALVDSLKMLPLLFVIYVLIELTEIKWGHKLGTAMAKAGRLGPVIGAVAGIIPQCGVSVVGAALYTQRLATARHEARGGHRRGLCARRAVQAPQPRGAGARGPLRAR